MLRRRRGMSAHRCCSPDLPSRGCLRLGWTFSAERACVTPPSQTHARGHSLPPSARHRMGVSPVVGSALDVRNGQDRQHVVINDVHEYVDASPTPFERTTRSQAGHVVYGAWSSRKATMAARTFGEAVAHASLSGIGPTRALARCADRRSHHPGSSRPRRPPSHLVAEATVPADGVLARVR